MNPYGSMKKNQQFVLASNGKPIDDYLMAARLNKGGSVVTSDSESFFGRDGHINASNKRDAMKAVQALAAMFQDGSVVTQKTPDARMVQAQRMELMNSAMNDKTGQVWQALGEVMAEEIFVTMGREGFARKILAVNPVGKGQVARIRVRIKDVTGWYMTTAANIPASVIRQRWVYPDDFYLEAAVLIEDLEISQSTGDLLDEKYTDALEQLMVKEDQYLKQLSDAAAGTSNDLFYFNTFTPTTYSQMKTEIARWGLPVASSIIAFDIWNDIIADTEFSNWFDPITKREIVLEGSLGSLLGVQIFTDAFRDPRLKVLNPGEVYFYGTAAGLGAITQREELTAENINTYNLMKPFRGWYMKQIEGMAIVNSRSVCRGQRV